MKFWKIFFWVVGILLMLFLTIPAGFYVLDPRGHDLLMPYNQVEDEQTQGVGIFVINLDRSPQRWKYVLPSIRQLEWPYSRVSGVDGSALCKEDMKDIVDLSAYTSFMGRPPEKGTVGCSLSHMKAWQAFLNSPFEYALIFEDDVSFDPSLLRQIVKEVLAVPDKWDLVNFENLHRSLHLPLASLTQGHELVSFLTPVTHAGCYLINRTAARRLLAKALPIKLPVDHYFSREWEIGLKFTGVLPNVVNQTHGTSQIVGTPRIGDNTLVWYKSAWTNIKRAAFRTQSDILRFVRTFKMYVKNKLFT